LSIAAGPVLSVDLAALFPAGVVAMEMRETGDAASLRAEEAAFVAAAVPSRVREFAAGRLCARRAMAEFGVVDFPLRVANDRRPVWPDGLVGSITHTAGLCAAVVAERRLFQSVGLDSEVVGDVGEPLWRKICVAAEIDWLRSLPPAQRAAGAALIFSAKEAFYKCQYPLTGEPLTFQDVRVVATFGCATGEFLIAPMRPMACAALTEDPLGGRFRFHEQFVTIGVGFVERA
jgi:4'-phosphopantetheinyl transferase EntD